MGIKRVIVVDDNGRKIQVPQGDLISSSVMPIGSGVPAGGTPGQVLKRDTPNNVVWGDAPYNRGNDIGKLFSITDIFTRKRLTNGFIDTFNPTTETLATQNLFDDDALLTTGIVTTPGGFIYYFTAGDGFAVSETPFYDISMPDIYGNTIECSASSQYTTYNAYRGFNPGTGLISDIWCSTLGQGTTQWVQVKQRVPKYVSSYYFYNRPTGTVYSINSWTLSSSDDGVNWTTRHTVAGNVDNTAGALRGPFTLDTRTIAKYWRMTITGGYSALYYTVNGLTLADSGYPIIVSRNFATINPASKVMFNFVCDQVVSGYTGSGGVTAFASTDNGTNWTSIQLSETPVVGTTQICYSGIGYPPAGSNVRVKAVISAERYARILVWGASWE